MFPHSEEAAIGFGAIAVVGHCSTVRGCMSISISVRDRTSPVVSHRVANDSMDDLEQDEVPGEVQHVGKGDRVLGHHSRACQTANNSAVAAVPLPRISSMRRRARVGPSKGPFTLNPFAR